MVWGGAARLMSCLARAGRTRSPEIWGEQNLPGAPGVAVRANPSPFPAGTVGQGADTGKHTLPWLGTVLGG